MKVRIRTLGIVFFIVACAHLASIFFGTHAWWIDIFAHFQLQLGFLLLCIAPLVWWYTKSKYLFFSIGTYGLIVLIWVCMLTQTASGGEYIGGLDVYYQNVLFSTPNDTHEATVNALAQHRARVYAFVEPNPHFVDMFESISGTPPTLQNTTNSTGCAVFVTDPTMEIRDARVIKSVHHDPICFVRFDTFDLFVVHPLPPTSAYRYERQNRMFEAIHNHIEASLQDGRAWFVVGDFNATLYSARFRDVFGAYTKTHFYTWGIPSPFTIPIDHAFGTIPHVTRVYPEYTSDHRGLGVTFSESY